MVNKRSENNYKTPHTTRTRQRRSQTGAGIFMGVAAVVLLMGTSSIASLLVLNIGFSQLFAEKLKRINTWATNYATAHASDSNVRDETRNYVQTLMLEMGMTPIGVSTSVTQANGQVQVVVTNGFQLRGMQGLLPSLVNLRDTQSGFAVANF